MKLEQWTLFVDMLGYRQINGSIKNDKDAQDFLAFMQSNSAVFAAMNGEPAQAIYAGNKEFDLYKYYEVTAAFISDSMIITFKPKDVPELTNQDLALMHSANALFIICLRLQALIFSTFFQKGIFLRGGVSNKYAMIHGQFAVGEGLVEAYEGESKFAKHPRIILHPAVASNAALMRKIEFLSEAMYSGHAPLEKDQTDGLYFIDYLGYAASTINTDIPMIAEYAKSGLRFKGHQQQVHVYFAQHAKALVAKLSECQAKVDSAGSDKEKSDELKVLSKFEWLKAYHNRIIAANPALSEYLVA